MIRDLAGIGQGFRDTNAWLIVLTHNTLPATFYAGDALGSFNSIMRFITGMLAGFAIAWLVFPYIYRTQTYDQQLDERSYAHIIEQIKDNNTNPSGG